MKDIKLNWFEKYCLLIFCVIFPLLLIKSSLMKEGLFVRLIMIGVLIVSGGIFFRLIIKIIENSKWKK